jgi:DNA uptake protein ComE-like DNA-binding protein
MVDGASRESETLAAIRRLLLGALAIGVLGTTGELILLRHIDEPTQWIPLVFLGVGVPVLIWHAVSPTAASVRVLQGLMLAFIALGVIGVGLHYDGNVEFERELHPNERGWTFVRKTLAGATPVLAPGSMVLLGLVGLAHAYHHPRRGLFRPETKVMKQIAGVVIVAASIAVIPLVGHAQVGKPVTIVDANLITEADLAKLPNMNAALAKAAVAKRPFKTVKDLDNALSSLTKEQRTELYGKLFVPINLNTATDDEILLIPGLGNRMLREFKEYRPYAALAQFHREIGKYVDDKELARLEQYVFVPVTK